MYVVWKKVGIIIICSCLLYCPLSLYNLQLRRSVINLLRQPPAFPLPAKQITIYSTTLLLFYFIGRSVFCFMTSCITNNMHSFTANEYNTSYVINLDSRWTITYYSNVIKSLLQAYNVSTMLKRWSRSHSRFIVDLLKTMMNNIICIR